MSYKHPLFIYKQYVEKVIKLYCLTNITCFTLLYLYLFAQLILDIVAKCTWKRTFPIKWKLIYKTSFYNFVQHICNEMEASAQLQGNAENVQYFVLFFVAKKVEFFI